MRLRNRTPNDEPLLTSEDSRRALLFWFFWSVYVCLSMILVAALLTDWPAFLHDPNPYF